MKIFITGATGLVGSAILRKLLRAGVQVRALFHSRTFDSQEVEWIRGDMTDDGIDVTKLVQGMDVVIHNAASLKTGTAPADIDEVHKANVIFTQKLVEASVASGVQKFLFTGSFSVLKKPLPAIITEESPTDPLLPYSVSKLKGEQLVMDISSRGNMDFNILRISSPLGRDLKMMTPNVVRLMIEQSAAGKSLQVYGKGRRTQDFISTSDIAEAFFSCMNQKVSNGIFNIASGKPISMSDIAFLITKKYGNSMEYSGTDVNEQDQWNISIAKAKNEFGFNPKFSSEAAIMDLLNSFKK